MCVAPEQLCMSPLGHGLLLKRYTPRVVDATDEQINQAALGTIPNVAAMFWMFRIMVGLGFYMLALIALSFYFCARRVFDQKRWLLKLLLVSLPVPWIPAELGWTALIWASAPCCRLWPVMMNSGGYY